MKAITLFIAIFALALLIIPMIALSFDTVVPTQNAVQVHTPIVQEQLPATKKPTSSLPDMQEELQHPSEDSPQASLPASTVSAYGVDHFKILDQSTGKVVSVPLRDFVRGAIAAEMPVSFHPEALKAQAVAAHTFALHNHIVQQQNPDPTLKGADFAADPSNMLVYITEEKAKEFYGNNGDLYWSKICQAADSVLPYVLEYDNEPIVAAYHAISAGQTENAANVWIGSAPYLQAADSEGDILAPDYETTASFSADEVEEKLLSAHPDIHLPTNPEDWFNIQELSPSGYVVQTEIGGVNIPGKEIRELLGLRSHNFQVEYGTDDQFYFTVRGYGHGVGLSQYGADFMARQGYTFDEILRNYYTGVNLKRIQLDDEQIA